MDYRINKRNHFTINEFISLLATGTLDLVCKLYCFIYYIFVFYYVFSEHVFIFPILFTCSSLYHQDSFAVCIAIVFHRDLEPFQTRLSYGIAAFETHRPQISCSQCLSTVAASFDSLREVSGQGQTYWNVL